MKTRITKLLALALVAALMLCGAAFAEPEYIVYEGDPRIVPEGEDVTFTIFQSLTSTVEDLSREKNQATKIIEDATGLKLEFVTAPQADAQTKLNLLLSSGDYPDIISRRGLSRVEMDLYAKEGVFVPLDEFITPEYAPNTSEIFANNEAARTICTGSDGQTYSLPDINECYHCLHGDGRAWYYMPWMESINGGVLPTTTEELETYLKYIRDNDVNGNGDAADEIPLAFPKDNVDRFTVWVNNFFQTYTASHYRVEDGQIVCCFTTPEFKQAMEYAHELYAEGLLLEDSFSIATDDLRRLGEDPNGARIGLTVGWGPEDGVAKAGTTLRWYQYFALSPVAGPTGVRNAVYTGMWGSVLPGYFVTDKCQNVQYAVQLGDLFLDEYYGYTTYIGPKGVSWDDPTEGAIGFNGQPAKFRELVAYGTQETNCSWDQTNITNRYADFRMSQEAEGADTVYEYLNGNYDLLETVAKLGSYNEIMKYYACEKNLHPYIIDEASIVPSLLYSDEMADIVADATAVVDAYRKEMVAAFVTGIRSLDEYDAYVDEMYSMGLQDILDAMNQAYAAAK